MRQKIALTIASIAAAGTLAFAFAVAGFAPRAAAAPVNAITTPAPTPIVQVDTVYIAPKPTQETITIQQAAPAGEPAEGNDGSEGND